LFIALCDLAARQLDNSGVNAMPGANQHRTVRFTGIGEDNPVKRCLVYFAYFR
jgi:hypothetical protein